MIILFIRMQFILKMFEHEVELTMVAILFYIVPDTIKEVIEITITFKDLECKIHGHM